MPEKANRRGHELRCEVVFGLRSDEVPPGARAVRMTTDRETLPPAAPDAEAADFEHDVRERGESSVRWDRLMALLAEREERSAC